MPTERKTRVWGLFAVGLFFLFLGSGLLIFQATGVIGNESWPGEAGAIGAAVAGIGVLIRAVIVAVKRRLPD